MISKKIFLIFMLFAVGHLFTNLPCKAQIGSRDISFGTGGKVLTDVGGGAAAAMAIQSDGKIVVTGLGSNGIIGGICLVRYNADGSLDNSFDNDGIVITPALQNADWQPTAIAIQSDGKILVAGENNLPGCQTFRDFFLLRYNTNGSLDVTFDSDGIVFKSVGDNDMPKAIALQSDGKIILAGVSRPLVMAINYPSVIAIARFNSNGSVDYSFDSDGVVTTSIGIESSEATAVAVRTNGKIVVAGNSAYGVVLAQYNANGSLDNSFDSDGITTNYGIGNYYCNANCLAIQNDGKVVIGGTTISLISSYDFMLLRYNTDGSLDNSFDTDGKVITDLWSEDKINAIKIQANGKIVAAGYTKYIYNNNALARYNINGSLDNSFDNDGIVIDTTIDLYEIANALAIQSDGKIVIAGSSAEIFLSMQDDIMVCRYTGDAVVSSIQETPTANALVEIYPNPCNLSTNIVFNTLLRNGELTVHNYIGKKVGGIYEINSRSVALDCSHFAKGIYYLKVTQNGTTVGSAKLLVQ